MRSYAAVVAIAVAVSLATPVVAAGTAAAQGDPAAGKVEAAILAQPVGKETDYWVTFRADADLAAGPRAGSWEARGEAVVDTLQDTADRSQAGVRKLLADRHVANEPFWISNAVKVTGTKALADELARRPEVEQVVADRAVALPDPIAAAPVTPQAVEWNLGAIRAPEEWATFGARGEGIVVANIDTGVQFDHLALAAQYRGNSAGTVDHNYNWFDPSHICGTPSLAPCDNSGHGTHTMGTMVGNDPVGGNQIGVAPGARWIAAKGCESSSCSYTALLASGQWVLAPTDLAGQNPRPDLRPNVVNNSWGGGPGDPFFADIVRSWVASGIFPAFANGNSGPGCGTAGSPGDYPESYAVGAYGRDGAIASFSSRGSATATAKPNLSAPGVSVRSSLPGSTYGSYSGTSMATPHVAATVALMWSAAPGLASNVALTREILDRTAVDTSDLTCGGTAAKQQRVGRGPRS